MKICSKKIGGVCLTGLAIYIILTVLESNYVVRKVTCEELINKYANKTATKEVIFKIATACGEDNINKHTSSQEAFKKVFSHAYFGHVTCNPVVIGPPSSRMPMVALASYPGSGNTWTRHMIEQLSGIQTGSLYEGVVTETFSGESLCPTNNNVFLVKTHQIGAKSGKIKKSCPRRQYLRYEKAVYIIRNPFNAFMSTYNLQNAGKTETVRKKSIKRNPKFDERMTAMVRTWERHVYYWLNDFKGPLHVLVYEQMRTDILWEMFKLYESLDVPVTLRSLWCLSLNTEGKYHRERKEWVTHDNIFTSSQTSTFKSAVNNVRYLLRTHGIGDDIIQSYYKYNDKM